MNCRQVRTSFSAYIEQELSEMERRDVSAHLARCTRCTSELFAMQKAMSLVRWVPRYEGSPGFEKRLIERLAAEETAPAPPERWRHVTATLAAKWDDLVAAMLVPAPVGALVLALVIGGGGGAWLMSTRQPGSGASAPPGPVATAPAVESAQPVTKQDGRAEPGTGLEPLVLTSTKPASPAEDKAATPRKGPAEGVEVASASGGGPETDARRIRPLRTTRTIPASAPSRRVDVASWASNEQPIEALPEGPPAVSQVEYILHLIDATGPGVEPLPPSAVVSGGTVTF